MLEHSDTVCAVSTPLSVGGISVIRISGSDAIAVAQRVFRPAGGVSPSDMSANTCAYGFILDDGAPIDDGVLTVFRAPKSYTGEDVAEISCHGGIYVTKQVLRSCIKAGAVPAQGGEFTKRAFLNGKLSLTQAESVMETISASGALSLRSSNEVRKGRLYRKIKSASDALVSLLAQLAAWNDYPDEDIPALRTDELTASLNDVLSIIDSVLEGYDSGRIFRHGADVAIVGRPNVGKSTLMNVLLGYERSIVTDIAGTTRDVIEESAVIGGITLRLSDTAGIRQTDDCVEEIGVELANNKLENCDLALAVFDCTAGMTAQDMALAEKLRSYKDKTIVLFNKSDLDRQDASYPDSLFSEFERTLDISAKEEINIDKLEAMIIDYFHANPTDDVPAIFINERQKLCAQKSKELLAVAIDALTNGETLDGVTVLIDKAADWLLELNGEKVTEAVVDKVFESFCVGK